MKLLDAMPPGIEGRAPKNALPVQCDCGIRMAWPRNRGLKVRCSKCEAEHDFTEELRQ